MRRGALARVLASASCLLLSGCIRNVVVHEFRDPEMRLRATVVPQLVAPQPRIAPLQNIELTMDVTAPSDSALMLVLDHRVAYERLMPFLGEPGVRFVRAGLAYWVHDAADTSAPAIMRVSLRDTTDLVERIVPLRFSTEKREKQLFGNKFVDSDFVDSLPWLMVVRKGTVTRLRVRAVVAGSEGLDEVLYHVRYQWIAVPDTNAVPAGCADHPIFVYKGDSQPCAKVMSTGATARRLEAYTHLIHENVWVITGVGTGLAAAIALISRP